MVSKLPIDDALVRACEKVIAQAERLPAADYANIGEWRTQGMVVAGMTAGLTIASAGVMPKTYEALRELSNFANAMPAVLDAEHSSTSRPIEGSATRRNQEWRGLIQATKSALKARE